MIRSKRQKSFISRASGFALMLREQCRLMPVSGRYLHLMMLSIGLLLAPAIADAAQGRGYMFVLHSVRSPFDTSLLDAPYVDGVAVQIGWGDVEPRAGSYDWGQLDKLIELSSRHGKQVMIHLLPLRPPEWLFDLGAEPFEFSISLRESPQYGKRLKEVVPWDPVYLERWARLTKALGERYSQNSAVLGVSVTAPSPEMILPGGMPRNDAFPRWQAIYKKNIYLDAWKRMIDVYQSAFPDKPKLLVPGIVLLDEYFADDVLAYAYGKFGDKLWVFNTGLRADGTAQAKIGRGHIDKLLREYARKTTLGLQTIWSSSNDPHNRMRGTLHQVLEKGVEMGACYFEIYAVDVSNRRLQTDLRNIASQLSCGAATD
jgi:hypothetical protein